MAYNDFGWFGSVVRESRAALQSRKWTGPFPLGMKLVYFF